MALLDKFHFSDLEQERENFSTFALFLYKTIPEIKVIPDSLIALLINTMQYFDYHTPDESKKCKAKAAMRKKRL